MSTPEETEIVEYVNSLLESTNAEQMTWGRVSPTTFQWTKVDKGRPIARLTVQKVSRRVPYKTPSGATAIKESTNYVLQAIDLLTATQKATITTEEFPGALPSLSALFDAAGSLAARQGLDFLRGLKP